MKYFLMRRCICGSCMGHVTWKFKVDFVTREPLVNTIDEKYLKIMHVMYETLPYSNMKFHLYFPHFWV